MAISEKRLNGWEATERHEHYDPEGVLTGFTLVTREPEWDDMERAKVQALADYEAGMCDCGLHRSVADTDPDMEMAERICPSCAALAKNRRIIAAADEKATKAVTGKALPPEETLPTDGRHLSLQMKPSVVPLEQGDGSEQ